MEILVVGGTKYFGIPMVWKLIADGHHVTLATRQKSKDIKMLVNRKVK